MSNDFERQYYEDENFWIDTVTDPRNVERIKKTADLIPSDVGSLVDVGCGNGAFLNYLLSVDKTRFKLLGVDRSKAALKFVNTEKLEASADQIPLSDNSYDCVSCLEVIEHLPVGVYEKSLQEIARIAGKHVIISVPYKEDLVGSFNQCPSCQSTFSYEMHLRTFNDERVQKLMEPYGFRCLKTEYMGPFQTLIGHDLYKRKFYPELSKKFVSPICPICGFINTNKITPRKEGTPIKPTSKQRFFSLFSAIPKMFWPKKDSYYWIAAVYTKL